MDKFQPDGKPIALHKIALVHNKINTAFWEFV